MSLLQAGVDTTVIALWLGHAGVRSTDAYVHADMTIKEKALALTAPVTARPGRYRPTDKVLALCRSSLKELAADPAKLRMSGRHGEKSKEQMMALVKKGSRRIVVDGVTYRWRVRHKPTYCQGNGWTPLTFAVEDATTPGTALVVQAGRPHPGNWFALPTQPVLPADVAQAIRTALARGWTPLASGSPFRLELSNGSATDEDTALTTGLSA
ncbi:hypothetical protein AB0I39_27105 [Kitasatospora purpeofusca]|uniref:hypothetical protein n=1 Tax=Kitasatospora purpeofusca TaxID=67352 RepID=UPI003410C8E1